MIEELNELVIRSIQQLNQTEVKFDRYLNTYINWDSRLILIKGSRGVGKTTLLLRHIQQQKYNSTEALYASLDDLWFNKYSIVKLGEWWVQQGGVKLLLDEVHKYKDWSREIKILYDRFPQLQIVITGSSAIELHKGEGDLSRRSRVYQMHGLSFREYLQLELGTSLPSYSFEEIIQNSTNISLEITKKLKPLKYFSDYLSKGYFPFYKEDLEGYYHKLRQVIQVVLEVDIPAVQQVDYSSVLQIKKLLAIIADLVPYKPNVSKLSLQIGISRETLVKYLQHLAQAGILELLYSNANGISLLNKPEKIYLNNTNFAYSLSSNQPDKGAIRETFAINQLTLNHQLSYPKTADILVDGKYYIEIGGKQKSKKQLPLNEKGFVLADDIEIAIGNKIPLWLLGMMY